jgi:hypothetical protein
MKVRDVMTGGALKSRERRIAEAIETMLRSPRSAPSFDADHALSGILSEGDPRRSVNSKASPSAHTG